MRELDVVLTRYMDRNYDSAPAEEQAGFASLLTLPDPEILDLLTGRAMAHDPMLAHVVERLLSDS